ncbi:hypothetical protein CBX91_05075 [Salmonella enterica]|uniref:Uncharacterized protein n=1 Tax=Salmonella enterica TaxID=28901 RepID=A0A634F4R8_SALER|nr:hypothetical protein [Salmonella enterica]
MTWPFARTIHSSHRRLLIVAAVLAFTGQFLHSPALTVFWKDPLCSSLSSLPGRMMKRTSASPTDGGTISGAMTVNRTGFLTFRGRSAIIIEEAYRENKSTSIYLKRYE